MARKKLISDQEFWEKKLEKYGLSEDQTGQPPGITGFPIETILCSKPPRPFRPDLPIVSPSRAAEIMRSHPPDKPDRPYYDDIGKDQRTDVRGKYLHLMRRRGFYPSVEDRFWMKCGRDDRWVPPMHLIESIARGDEGFSRQGSAETTTENYVKHPRSKSTGLGRSHDKTNYPAWARNRETLSLVLNYRFPDLSNRPKKMNEALSVIRAIEAIWKKRASPASELERDAMKKRLKRLRKVATNVGSWYCWLDQQVFRSSYEASFLREGEKFDNAKYRRDWESGNVNSDFDTYCYHEVTANDLAEAQIRERERIILLWGYAGRLDQELYHRFFDAEVEHDRESATCLKAWWNGDFPDAPQDWYSPEWKPWYDRKVPSCDRLVKLVVETWDACSLPDDPTKIPAKECQKIYRRLKRTCTLLSVEDPYWGRWYR